LRFLAAAAKPFTALRLGAFGADEDGGSKQQEYDERRKRYKISYDLSQDYIKFTTYDNDLQRA